MKENWLALYLAIIKGINASKALTLMKAGKTRKKSCGNSSIKNYILKKSIN